MTKRRNLSAPNIRWIFGAGYFACTAALLAFVAGAVAFTEWWWTAPVPLFVVVLFLRAVRTDQMIDEPLFRRMRGDDGDRLE